MKQVLIAIIVFAVSALHCSAAGIEGALYDSLGKRIGPALSYGQVLTKVAGRVVQLRVHPIGQSNPGYPPFPPDLSSLHPINDGEVYWTGAGCTGRPYLRQGDELSSGYTLHAVFRKQNGQIILYTASPVSDWRTETVLSVRGEGVCYAYEEPIILDALKEADSKIDLNTIFVVPYKLR